MVDEAHNNQPNPETTPESSAPTPNPEENGGPPESGQPTGDTPASGTSDDYGAHDKQEELIPRLNEIRDILDGKTFWGTIIQDTPQLEDARTALEIVYKYNPTNDGTIVPRASLGDLETMREDALHIAALNIRLAALGAMMESTKEVVENERRLARSRAYVRIRRDYKRRGEKATDKLLEHEANASVAYFYNLQSDVEMLSRILSWVRVAAREFHKTLNIAIQASARENREDARLQ